MRVRIGVDMNNYLSIDHNSRLEKGNGLIIDNNNVKMRIPLKGDRFLKEINELFMM